MYFRKLNSKGFTIIELLIASVAFSTIIILITVLVIQISKVYYKGIIISNTQNSARNIVLDVEKSIQFSSHLNSNFSSFSTRLNNSNSWINWYCVGDQLFAYQTLNEFNTSQSLYLNGNYNIGFVYNLTSTCPSSLGGLTPYVNGTSSFDTNNAFQELLGSNMTVRYFKIIPPSNNNQNIWQIILSIGYGNDNLSVQNPNNKSQYNCITQIGDQYCATANLSAEVSPIGE